MAITKGNARHDLRPHLGHFSSALLRHFPHRLSIQKSSSSLKRLLTLSALASSACGLDMLTGTSAVVSVDGVMGGRSSGQLSRDADGTTTFSGNVNTNGGGFSYAVHPSHSHLSANGLLAALYHPSYHRLG